MPNPSLRQHANHISSNSNAAAIIVLARYLEIYSPFLGMSLCISVIMPSSTGPKNST